MNKTGIAVMLLLALFSGLATAAKVTAPGNGIYDATLAFKKTDTKAITTVQTGTQGIGTVGSMGWNDPAVNPDIPGNTEFSKAYGSTQDVQWFLLDLNKLKSQGFGSVWVTISVSQVGSATLVPALTVWNGNLGSTTGEAWFPNTFQPTPTFWGQGVLSAFLDPDLKPTYATASGTSNTTATIVGRVKLKKGKKNFLTVAVGGDDRLPESKHAVDFQLQVKLSKKKPAISNNGSGSGATLDSYGCKIGATCWHPQMGHCMSVATCDDAQYAGQCLCSK